jgi:hypothetical protein
MSPVDSIARYYRSLRLRCVPIGAEFDVLEGWHRSLVVGRHRPKALDPACRAARLLRDPPNVLTACAPNDVPRRCLLSWHHDPTSAWTRPCGWWSIRATRLRRHMKPYLNSKSAARQYYRICLRLRRRRPRRRLRLRLGLHLRLHLRLLLRLRPPYSRINFYCVQ